MWAHANLLGELILSAFPSHGDLCDVCLHWEGENGKTITKPDLSALKTNKKCFFSCGFGLIALSFKSLVFWLHFFFIYFQVDVMAYGENLFNLLFLLKKLFFPNFSSISLWSLILVLAYLGIKNVCNFFVCEVFQIWEVMLNDHLPKMIYPHFNSTYDKNCIISRDAWYNNLIHLLSIALPINIKGSMFRWKHFQLKTNKPAKRC